MYSNEEFRPVFSPDGTSILTTPGDGTAQLWDAEGQPLAILEGHAGQVNSAVFSSDGSRILTASEDGTARLWHFKGQPLTVLKDRTGSIVGPVNEIALIGLVLSAVFSPNGTYILTASRDGIAQLWDAEGQPLVTLEGHTDWVRSAVFSSDGTRILTTSADGTARLWNAEGQLLAALKGHEGSVYSAVFSPDGTRILTASVDGTVRIWPVEVEDWLAAAACRVGRSLSDEEIRAYNVPTPLKFDYNTRQCPPVYSWERPQR